MTRLGAQAALILGALLALAGCATMPIASAPASERAQISASLMQDIRVLSSNEFGGRKPGTDGEELTLNFITQEMIEAGLESGTNDPSSAWRARFRMISTQPKTSRIVISSGQMKTEIDAESGLAFTSLRRALVEGAEMVFVGKLSETVSEDMIAGKVVVMLGEPGVSPGRRRVLFEKNPSAILTIVENEEAIANTRRAFGRERLLLASEASGQLSGFITQGALSETIGQNAWNEFSAEAETEGFEPRVLTTSATIEATSDRREFTSANVVGRLPGSKPGSGAVMLLAHWDHLGECGRGDAEDRICNGAVDNASGIALMLELARRLSASEPHERDIYFLATSAEESGLLGAKAFIEAPAVGLDTIVAAFNFDTVALAPTGTKVGFVGEGRTPLDTIIREVLAESGRELGDKDFAESFVQRQDGWAFLQEGIPAVMLSTAFSSEIVLGPYLSTDYHRASDEIENIELGGAIDDLLLHEVLIQRVANTATYPAISTEGGG